MKRPKTTDYKDFNLNSFKMYLSTILEKRFKSKITLKLKKEQIEIILSKETSRLSAKSFYRVFLILEENFDSMCKKFFEGHTATKLKSLHGHNNQFQSLFSPLINSKAQISDASKIKISRLNELFDKRFDEIYAYEVYGLAIAFGLQPSQLFDYFYGDGEKPVIGV